MKNFTLSVAAAALFVGLGTVGASAMPMNNLSGIDVGAKTEQVRTVCSRYGRCWFRPNYYNYGGYGYGGYGYNSYAYSPGYNSYYGGPSYYGGWHHRRW